MFSLIDKINEHKESQKNFPLSIQAENWAKFKKDNNITDDFEYLKDEINKTYFIKVNNKEILVTEIWNKAGEHFFKASLGKTDKSIFMDFYFNSKEEMLKVAKDQNEIDRRIDEIDRQKKKEKEQYQKQVQKNVSLYKEATNEEKSEMIDNFSYDELEELFSDDNITSGTYVGGYVSHSKSRSALASEEQGSKPKSKWTKDDIIEYINEEPSLEPFYKELEKMPLNKLKDVALYEDGWHHTGRYYNKTSYYGIASPHQIVSNIINARQMFARSLKNNLE